MGIGERGVVWGFKWKIPPWEGMDVSWSKIMCKSLHYSSKWRLAYINLATQLSSSEIREKVTSLFFFYLMMQSYQGPGRGRDCSLPHFFMVKRNVKIIVIQL